jgi:hypothetical protein
MATARPWLARFLHKLAYDVAPAALASLVGGLLISHYQWFLPFTPTRQAAPVQVETPASPEMLQLVRDEHATIVGYLQAQTAAEKARADAEATEAAEAAEAAKPHDDLRSSARDLSGHDLSGFSADARIESAPLPAPSQPSLRNALTAAAAKHGATRTRPAAPIAAAPAATLNIARGNEDGGAGKQNDSLIGRTIGHTVEITNHVVDVTHRAISAIGGIPSWVGSAIGDRLGGSGGSSSAPPPPRLVSAS